MIDHNIDSLKNLHFICFEDSREYIDFFFSTRFRPENCFASYENGEAASAVYVRYMKASLYGKSLNIPFLTGVATRPESRYKGYAARLLEEAAAELKRRGDPFALLHPFSEEFYRKQGYATIARYEEKTVADAADYSFETSREINIYDCNVAAKLYASSLADKRFRIEREPADFLELFTEHFIDGGSGYLITEHGIPNGYILTEDNNVREYVLPEGRDLSSLFMLSGFSYYDRVGKGKCAAMARLLDPGVFFASIPYNGGVDKVFNITLSDQTYRLEISDGALVRCENTEESGLVVDPRDMVALGLGRKSEYRNRYPESFLKLFCDFELVLFDKY